MSTLWLGALLALAACAPAAEPAATPRGTAAPAPATQAAAATPSGSLPPEIRDAILRDIAARTGQRQTAPIIVSAEIVTWPDPSLGCPEPGMVYPEVLVEGYWVIVEARGERFDYRGGEGGFRLCTIPEAERSGPVAPP